MKRIISALALCIFIAFPSAFAETEYASIASMHSTIPERFQKEYISSDGKVISIDAPVIIPDVDTFPIVRVTWGGPVEITDSSLCITVNDANVLQVEHGFTASSSRFITDTFETVNDRLAHNDAAQTLLNSVCNLIPEFSPQDFECINSLSYRYKNGSDGFYMLFFARLYHGIPYLCNAPYAIPLGNAEPDIPNEVTHACIEDSQHFTISISSPKEIGIIENDVPLLPFERIENIISQWIETGYVERLDEIRLGYRIFVDPNHPGTEYILAPVWVFSGSMRAALDVPFVKEDIVFMPYKNTSSFAINAQTGEIYTFAFESSKSRQTAPEIIKWN